VVSGPYANSETSATSESYEGDMATSTVDTYSVGRVINRAAVIGAAGFIGASLSSWLAGSQVDTACFTRSVRVLNHRNELNYALQRSPVVYYLASSINPTLGEQHPDWAAADHQSFSRLLRQFADLDDPPAVVLTSSGGTVYDQEIDPPYPESAPVRASGRYGQAKLALEKELYRYSGRIPGVILRLANVYGPGQIPGKGQGVLGYWMRAALDGEPLRIIGDPGCSRDYVYITDVVDCLARVDMALRTGQLFPDRRAPGDPVVLNIGSGVATSLTELVSVVREVIDPDLPIRYTEGRSLDRKHFWLDVTRAGQTLGWRPSTGLAEGVARMWQWTVEYDRRGLLAKQAPVAHKRGRQPWPRYFAPGVEVNHGVE
jgi:UDP-glucose 4-epimerase